MNVRLLKILACVSMAMILFFFPDINIEASALFVGLMAILVVYAGTALFSRHPRDNEYAYYLPLAIATMTIFLLITRLPNFPGAREILVAVPIIGGILISILLLQSPGFLLRVFVGTELMLIAALVQRLHSPFAGTFYFVLFCACTFFSVAFGRFMDGEGNDENWVLMATHGTVGTLTVLGCFFALAGVFGDFPFPLLLTLAVASGMLIAEGLISYGFRLFAES